MNLCPKEGDNGKYGYINPYYHLNWRLRGKKIDFNTPEFEIMPIYDEVRKFVKGFAEVKMNGKWGIINEDGEFIIKPQYEDIVKRNNGLYRVKVDGKWGLMNEQETIIRDPKYDEVGKCYDNLIDVKIGDKTGFINLQWQLMVEPQFDSFHFYYDIEDNYPFGKRIHSYGLMRVEIGEKKGLIDTKDGHYIFEPQFDFIGDKIFCWFLRIKKNGKWGIISTDGDIIAEPVYDEIDGFGEHISPYEVARVRINDKWGVINRKGDFIIEPQPLTIDVRDGYSGLDHIVFVIGDKRKIYLIKSGLIVDKVFFDDFSAMLSHRAARFVVDDKMGFIDKDGKIFVEPQFDDAEAFSDGYATVKVHDKWGLIDFNGDCYFEPRFDTIIDKPKHESGGYPLIRVKVGEKIGFLNIDDHLVIEPQYEETEGCYDNIKVKTDGKWGIVNRHGLYVLDPLYEQINDDWYYLDDDLFELYWAKDNKKWSLLRKDFSFIAKSKFDDYIHFSRVMSFALAAVKTDDKWGYINYAGCFIIDPKFDEVGSFFSRRVRLAPVKDGEKWGYINQYGDFIVEPCFEYASNFELEYAHVKVDDNDYSIDKYGSVIDFKYYQNEKRNRSRSFHHNSYYGSAQESAKDGWDLIAGDAGFDSGDVDSEGLWEFLGLD